MDKYEYNVKLEQIKKLIKKKDYATAARIADTIDWYKVKNNQTIVMIADVYEASGRYEQSRENLKLAYDRSGLGRQIAYKLVKICIKCGELEEAEDFYDDFVSAAPRDISKYLLQYELSKAKGDPIDSQISILEQYLEEDMDDKWAFELAKLYHKSGQRDKCIQQCDTVMLWFSDGKYVEKAMDLKMIYTPLSKSQQERYEARWREKSGQPSVNVDEIRVKEVDVANKYNTQNIQDALKESMEELYSEEKKNIFKPSVSETEYDKSSESFSEAAIYDEAEETAAGTDDYIYRMNQSSEMGTPLENDMFSRRDDLGDTKVFVTTRSKKGMGDTKVFAPIRQAMPERVSFEEPEEMSEEAYILEERTIKNQPETMQGEAFEEEIDAVPEEAFEEEIYAVPEEVYEEEIEIVPEETFEEEIDAIPEEILEEAAESFPEEVLEEAAESFPEEVYEEEIDAIPEEILEEAAESFTEEVLEEDMESFPEEALEEDMESFSEEVLEEDTESFPEEVYEAEPEESISKEEAAVSEEETQEADMDEPISIEDFFYGGGYYVPEEETDDMEETEIDIEGEEDIEESEDIEEPEIGFEESGIEEEPEDIEEPEIEYDRSEMEFEEPEEDIEEPEIEYKNSEIWEEPGTEITDEQSEYQEPESETEYEELRPEAIEESESKYEYEYQEPETIEESEPKYEYEELRPETLEESEAEYEYQEPESETQESEYAYRYEESEPEVIEEPEPEYAYQEPEPEEPAEVYESAETFSQEPEPEEEDQVLTHDEIKAIIKDFIGKYSGIQGLDKQMLRTLQNIIVDDSCNIFIMGDAKSGKTSLGLDIIKVVNKIKRNNNRRIAKISADKLIGKELSVYFTRLRGSDIYIENISLMDEDTVSELLQAMDKDMDNRIVVIEDEKINAEKFLNRYSEISRYFVNHIVVKQNKIKDWVQVAREYAQEQGYEIDEMGMLALHAKIDQLYAITLVIQKNHVDAVIDNAIRKANKGGLLKKLFSKRKEKILTEEHFN